MCVCVCVLDKYDTYTVWHKCVTAENFVEFDESKLYRQNFPSQYFAVDIRNLSASTCNTYGSCKSVY